MKKSVFLLSLFVSLSSLANGLDQLDLSGNLRIEYGKNVYHKNCQNIEKSTSGQDLERLKGDLVADMQRQKLSGAVKFFNCPIAATGGRISEFVYIAKNASNVSVLVVANPMQDQVYEIVASELGKIWFAIPRSDLNGTLIINPENQAN